MLIRTMTIDDIGLMDDLLAQLGYPATKEQIEYRLTNFINNDMYNTFVAVIDNQLVGFVGMCKQLAYENDQPYVRVLALVVHEAHRRKNVGGQLMEAAETWAKNQGCYAVTLNSGNRPERVVAHKFYDSIGYSPKSTGFYKSI